MLPCPFRQNHCNEQICLFGVPGKHITNDIICSGICGYKLAKTADHSDYFNICHFMDMQLSIDIEKTTIHGMYRCMKFGSTFDCSTCQEVLPIVLKGGISLGGIDPHEFEFVRKKESLRKHLFGGLNMKNTLMRKCFITGGECAKNIIPLKNGVFIAFRHTQANENVFKYGIKPALDTLGLIPIRAKDYMSNIDFMCKICEMIQKSEFVIADISEEKLMSVSGISSDLDEFSKTAFNVGYELGIAHGLGKQTIILRKIGTKEHQDLKRNEAILYTDDYDKLSKDIVTMFTDTQNHTI